jgi:hypothetical protein
MENKKLEVKPVVELTPTEMMATVVTLINGKPHSHNDCENLRKLQAQINQAVYELCDTCQPVEINPNDSGIDL